MCYIERECASQINAYLRSALLFSVKNYMIEIRIAIDNGKCECYY